MHNRQSREAGFLGATIEPNQPGVNLRVHRGENTDPHKNDYLGQLILRVKHPSHDPVPIATVFRLDEDGILHFKAVDVPLDRRSPPAVLSLVQDASSNRGVIDISLLDSLITSEVLPQSEAITIDPR